MSVYENKWISSDEIKTRRQYLTLYRCRWAKEKDVSITRRHRHVKSFFFLEIIFCKKWVLSVIPVSLCSVYAHCKQQNHWSVVVVTESFHSSGHQTDLFEKCRKSTQSMKKALIFENLERCPNKILNICVQIQKWKETKNTSTLRQSSIAQECC